MEKLRNVTFILLLVALTVISHRVHAQERAPLHVAVKINPLSLLLLTGNGKIEFPVAERVSVQFGGYYGGIKTRIGSPQSGNAVRYRQWALIPEVRIYPLPGQSAPNGLYIAPYFRYRQTDMELRGSFYDPDILGLVSGRISNHVVSLGGGALLGYQYVTFGGFVMDAYFGFAVSDAKNNLLLECDSCDGNEYLQDFKFRFGTGGFGVRFGLGLGYAF